MARISLNCSCGWNFFIPGATPGHEVSCPSCAQTVRIPGRKPGKDVPLTPGEIAAEKQRQQRAIKMMVGAGVLVVVLAGTIIAFTMGSTPPEDPNAISMNSSPGEGLTGLGGAGGRKGKAPVDDLLNVPPPPPPPPALYNTEQIQQLRRGVYVNVWLSNMTGLLSEVMRLRNLTNEWGQLQADMAVYDGKIKHNLGELAKVGEKQPVETYLAQGDKIIGFAQRDLSGMKAGEAAQLIHFWINNWKAGPQLEQVNVDRGGQKMTLYLEFPEQTVELLALLRHPALGLAGDPVDAVITDMVALPADLVKDLNGRFDSLPPGYRGYLPPVEGKRLEQLLLARKGTQDDIDWIKSRILAEIIPSFQREADAIRAQILALEPKLKDNAATDVIVRKNGTRLEGKILQQNEQYVKIAHRNGNVTIPMTEIERVELGKGSAVEFPARYADARGKLQKMVPLLAWCAEKNLKLEKEFVAYVVLTLDASNERARTTVGLGRPATTGTLIVPPKYPASNTVGRMEGVERAVEVIASDVLSRSQIFTDVVTEMRRRTESLTTTLVPVTPERSAKGVSLIANPLTFKPQDLTVPHAMEIGTWWNALPHDERRQFAKYYGLWCAYTRSQRK